ncbi:MAG: TonB-dependent receptor [Rhodothermales bacterium]
MRLLALLFLSLLATPLVAAQRADSVPADTTLPAVSVVATRAETAVALAPARVTVLDAEAVEAVGASSVADLLDARSAVFVRRYGAGGLASLSLRGTGASQTLVLLDGHRIADPQLGQLDVGLLPTVLLERVEILHGAGSALYGTDGVGGVIDLRTARPGRDRLTLASMAGAWGERSFSGLAAGTRGAVSALVAAETQTSEGDFTFFDPNAGLDGATARRDGADRVLHSVYARVELAPDGPTRGQVGAWVGAAERGLPGSVGSASQDERQWDRHLRVWGDVASRLGPVALRAGGLVQRASLRYRNAALGLDDTGRTWLGSGEIEARALVHPAWVVAGGVTGGVGTASHPNLRDDARETRLGAFVHATGDLGRILLYPALRADVYLRSGGAERMLAALSPRLGVNAQPVAAWPLWLKASAGLAFRAPTFNDRFWQPGGDPDLRPERGWTADLGAAVERGGASAEVSVFASRLRDQIVWQPAAGGFYAPKNLSRTRTLGLEASARRAGVRLGRTVLGGGLIYTLTDARDRSRPGSTTWGHQLRYVPRHQFKLHADAALALGSATKLRLDAGGRFTSARPVRSDGSLDLPATFTLDGQIRLHHRFPQFAAALALAVENALDAEIEVVRGYPMPPRHARLRLHLSF